MASPNGIPTSIEPRKVPCAPSCRAGRRSTGGCQCPGAVQMENWGGGATHSNQELEIDVSGSCVTFQATRWASAPRPPPMAGPVCGVGHQRQRQKTFRLGHDAFRPIHREQRGPAPFGFPAKSPCRATTCTAKIWKGRRSRKEEAGPRVSRDEGELGVELVQLQPGLDRARQQGRSSRLSGIIGCPISPSCLWPILTLGTCPLQRHAQQTREPTRPLRLDSSHHIFSTFPPLPLESRGTGQLGPTPNHRHASRSQRNPWQPTA